MRHATGEEELRPFLEDAAHYPGGHARAIWFPTSEAEVATVLRHDPQVLVIGAQSSRTGGATPFGDVLLSTARMSAIGPFTGARVVVGPGVILNVLDQELRARGLYYPPTHTVPRSGRRGAATRRARRLQRSATIFSPTIDGPATATTGTASAEKTRLPPAYGSACKSRSGRVQPPRSASARPKS